MGHQTMPQRAFRYAVPDEWYETLKIRRYGFHGISHKYVAKEAAKFLGKEAADTNVVICHLGNGDSVTAVRHGKSVETSMGFTPEEGLIMGTRCGDIGAGALEYASTHLELDAEAAMEALNKGAGLLGLCGMSDMRDIEDALEAGDPRAQLAHSIFCYRIRKYAVGYIGAALDGNVDAIVFTAGIGENSWRVREQVCGMLEGIGIDFDYTSNRFIERGVPQRISREGSAISVLVIPTNEELEIAREAVDL